MGMLLFLFKTRVIPLRNPEPAGGFVLIEALFVPPAFQTWIEFLAIHDCDATIRFQNRNRVKDFFAEFAPDCCRFRKPLQNIDLVATLSTTAMPFVAADRVRARIREEMARKNLNQADVAGLLEWTESRVSKVLNGRTELGVNELEALCFAVGLAMTEAVRDHGFEFCAEMTPTELRALEQLRALPATVRDHFLGMLAFQSKTRLEQRGITKSKPIIPKGRAR